LAFTSITKHVSRVEISFWVVTPRKMTVLFRRFERNDLPSPLFCFQMEAEVIWRAKSVEYKKKSCKIRPTDVTKTERVLRNL